MSINAEELPATVAPLMASPVRVISSRTVLFWSIRREIWENKAIYIAPAIVAMLLLLAISVGAAHVQISENFDPDMNPMEIIGPLGALAGMIMFTSFIISFFYCLDALYGEKRDRSILFWKSLPVSDLVAVSAKAIIPMAVVPAVTLVVVVVLQAVVLVAGSAVLLVRGLDVKTVIVNLPIFTFWGEELVRIGVLVLWYAPIYAWLFLVSALARRAPFVWAVLIPIGALVLEKIAFGTFYIGQMLRARLFGGLELVQVAQSGTTRFMTPVPPMDVAGLLGRPSLWLGLLAALLIMGIVVYLRRSREPI